MRAVAFIVALSLPCVALAATWTTPQDHGGTESTAIQAAVDTGLDVYFEGTFLVDTTIQVTTKTGQSFWGPGTIKLAAGRPLGTQIFNLDKANNVTFRYLKFDGQKDQQTQPPDDNTWNSGAPRTYFTPIKIDSSSNIKVEHCEFYDVCTTGVDLSGSRNVQVRLNHFHDSYMDAIFSSGEKDLALADAGRDVAIERNLIEDITYRDSAGDIIHAYGNGLIVSANDLVVRWNHIENVDRSGMKPVDKDRENALVEYNTVINPQWDGISSQGGSDQIIQYNDLIDCGVRGLGVLGANAGEARDNIVVQYNNILRSSYGTASGARGGIVVTTDPATMTGLVLRENVITDSAIYGIYVVDWVGGQILGNQINQSVVTAIQFGQSGASLSSDTILVQSNIIDGAKDGASISDDSVDITFDSNDLSTIERWAFYLNEPTGTTLLDNVVNDSGDLGALVNHAIDTTIDGNEFSNIVNYGVSVSGTPVPDQVLFQNNDFDTIGRYGIFIPGSATNITIGAGNTYTNMGVGDVFWPEEP